MGQAISPLRDEGVLLFGSGMSFHNMRGFTRGSGGPVSAALAASKARACLGSSALIHSHSLKTYICSGQLRPAGYFSVLTLE